eukprot:6173349-Pleurochrysis_carterae.AAC.1
MGTQERLAEKGPPEGMSALKAGELVVSGVRSLSCGTTASSRRLHVAQQLLGTLPELRLAEE